MAALRTHRRRREGGSRLEHLHEPPSGFSIDYPATWHTDHTAPDFACGYFDPRPFELPREGDWEAKALQVIVSPEDAALGNPTSRTEVTVGGRQAIRFERLTADGLVQYGYVLEDGGRTFSVLTTNNKGVNAAPWRRIVDRAVETLVVTQPRIVRVEGASVPPAQAGLPTRVAAKRAKIWLAASQKDYDALARLVDPDGFTYTFGGPQPGGPAAYWRRLEGTEQPVETLQKILELPYAYQPDSKLYVWPFAFTRKSETLSLHEKSWLAEALGEEQLKAYEQLGSYLGYRAGIDGDGDWVFYVAGD